jgi:ribonuclease HI
MDKLGRKSYKLRNNAAHAVHREHVEAEKLYHRTLDQTKNQHWRDWLERAVDPDIWTVHKCISAPASDGAKARIPALKHKCGTQEVTATTNQEKSQALAKSFFPARPEDAGIDDNHEYPPACCAPDKVTKEQIEFQIRKLKPYKAPGPDGIPNIVLMRCADLLLDRLLHIYCAMLKRNLHYAPWKTFTTVVLRKPGKPRYDVPKAYRPIALLNTTWKVLAAVIADQLTFYSEKYQLLPMNHFGGRPGRTTTDAVHLLTHKIKNAWRQGEVSSVLFLDVEGAFPNAVPDRLIHNLRKRRIPKRYTDFIANMLVGRITFLKFDDHTSDAININNGIGQGDPLSMVLYQFYNADILEIPAQPNELAIAYVDDALIMATAKDFAATHRIISDMMAKVGGVNDWSKTHNSPLELSKLALIDFAHRNNKKVRPNLTLTTDTVISPVESTKYLGIVIDQHLNWKAQHAYAIEKGTKWASQIRRVARPSWGITPKYARRLYIGVALPRILYGADVWCGPPVSEHPGPKDRGSAKVIRQLTSIQRSGAIAITGALRTSPTDTLDACAYLLPAILTVEKWCHRAAVRLATTPPGHPLYKPVNNSKRYIKRHRTPLHILFKGTGFNTKHVEKIPSKPRNPAQIGKLPFTVSISTSKEASVLEDRFATEQVKVYSDGSAQEGKVGAAAVLTRPGKPNRTLHYHLGSEAEHTVPEAELIGIILALHLIKTERKSNTPCAIGTDNHAALKAFQTNLRSPAHNAAREILRIGNMLQKNSRGKQFKLTLRWTAGHVGIPGNERADEEAKRAAAGLSSEKSILPTFLKRELTINPSAVQRKRNSEIKQRWQAGWKSSKRGKTFSAIDNKSPSIRFLRTISKANISRRSASLITQLTIGHVPLNEYLKRFKLVDSARCPACGTAPETVRHFLLECPIYAHERWILAKRLSGRKKTMTLRNLLGDEEASAAISNFIHASQRFASHT